MAIRRRDGVVNPGRSAGRLEREATKMPVGRVTDEVRCGGHPWPSSSLERETIKMQVVRGTEKGCCCGYFCPSSWQRELTKKEDAFAWIDTPLVCRCCHAWPYSKGSV